MQAGQTSCVQNAFEMCSLPVARVPGMFWGLVCVGEDGICPWMGTETSLAPFSCYHNRNSYQFLALVTDQEEYWPPLTSLMGKKTMQGQSYRRSNCHGSQCWTHYVPNILKPLSFLSSFPPSLPPFIPFFFHFFLLSY